MTRPGTNLGFSGSPASTDLSPMLSLPDSARIRSWLSRARAFVGLVLRKSSRDAITLQAAALAFVTILALIPLLAAFSFIGTRILDTYQQRILAILTQLLPYSESDLMSQIEGFVSQAESLQETGTLIFVIVSLGAFATIEQTINRIWMVSSRRSFRTRLLSFTLVLFWGPLVIGSLLSLVLILGNRPGLGVIFRETFIGFLIPYVITLGGLTMLYWQVPYTSVRFRSALFGGASAALLLEMLRRGFGIYVGQINTFSYVVYGGFALALFFMISIQLAWFTILLGSELAYVHQHFESMTQSQDLDARFKGPWVGLSALLVLADGLRCGGPIVPSDGLANCLRLAPDELDRALQPLREAEYVEEVSGESEGYVLACDPHELEIGEILDCYDRATEPFVATLPDEIAARIREVWRLVGSEQREATGSRTLADLMPETGTEETAEPVYRRCGNIPGHRSPTPA